MVRTDTYRSPLSDAAIAHRPAYHQRCRHVRNSLPEMPWRFRNSQLGAQFGMRPRPTADESRWKAHEQQVELKSAIWRHGVQAEILHRAGASKQQVRQRMVLVVDLDRNLVIGLPGDKSDEDSQLHSVLHHRPSDLLAIPISSVLSADLAPDGALLLRLRNAEGAFPIWFDVTSDRDDVGATINEHLQRLRPPPADAHPAPRARTVTNDADPEWVRRIWERVLGEPWPNDVGDATLKGIALYEPSDVIAALMDSTIGSPEDLLRALRSGASS